MAEVPSKLKVPPAEGQFRNWKLVGQFQQHLKRHLAKAGISAAADPKQSEVSYWSLLRFGLGNPARKSARSRCGASRFKRMQEEVCDKPVPLTGFSEISASPWQLYQPLAAFLASNRFPAGGFELKQFRWKDRSFFSLFASPEQYKPGSSSRC